MLEGLLKKSGLFVRTRFPFRSTRWLWMVFAVILIALASWNRYISSSAIMINWDTGIFIDGAYRVFCGQVPHKDFSTVIGSFVFYIGALGYWIHGSTDIAGLETGFSIFAFIMGIVTVILLWRRIGAAVLIVILYAFPFLASSMGLSYGSLIYTGCYNKIGYYFLFIILVYGISARKVDQGFICSFLIGIMAVVLLIVKLPFGLVGLMLLGGHALFNKKNLLLKEMSYFGCGVLLATTIYLCALQGDVVSLFRDLKILALSGHSIHSIPNLFISNFRENWHVIVISFFSPLLLKNSRDQKVCWFLGGLYILVCSPVLVYTIAQPPDWNDRSFMLMLVCICKMTESVCEDRDDFNISIKKALLCCVLIIMSITWGPYLSIKNTWGGVARQFYQRITDSGVPLKERLPVLDLSLTERELLDFMVVHPQTRRLKWLFVDLPVSLTAYQKMMPAYNTPLYWHYHMTYAEQVLKTSYFDEKNLFKDVDVIVIPKEIHYKTVSAFTSRYGDYLKKGKLFKLTHSSVYLYDKQISR